MRLTLRTLLAWMDGVLPEADRGPLGEKVAASPVARQLVERIEAVIARPHLHPPRVEGKGLASDPNSVAQYLDNTLPADQLEPFERVCLESDTHLAEVAGCHQILAEHAADPDALPAFDAAGRARLLAALRHVAPVPPGVAPRERGGAARGAATRADEPRTIPAGRRRRRPWLAWFSATCALLVVAALVGLLTRSLTRGQGGREVAVRPPAAEAPAALPAAPPGGADDTARTGGEAPAAAEVMAAVTNGGAEPSPTPTGDAPAQPAAAPAATPADGGPDEPVGQVSVAVAVPPPTEPDGGGNPGLPVDAAPAATIAVAGEWPLVWRARGGAGEWTAALPGGTLPLGADIVVPPGCTPEITLADVTFHLLPRTRAVVTMDGADPPRLELVFGRAVIRSGRPDAVVAIDAAGQNGTLGGNLTGGVALEVSLERAAGDDPAVVPAATTGALIPVAAGVRWTPARPDPGEVALESRRRLSWDARDPTAVAVAEPASLPAWAAGDGGGDRLERAAAGGFRARLAAGEGLGPALTEMATARRVEERSMAAATQALLGRFEPLVALLVADSAPLQLQNRQWEAVAAGSVPLALARGANAAARLRQAIAAQAPPGKADLLWRLAIGFTPEQIAAGGANELLAALADDALVVRRYALLRLVEATHASAANQIRYRPDAPPDRRRAGIEWWQRALDDALSGGGRGR